MQTLSVRWLAMSVVTFSLLTTHVVYAQSSQAPHVLHAKAQVSPTLLEMARKKVRLEEQLGDAQLMYMSAHPGLAVLRQRIADYNRLVTPQASATAISERIQDLQNQRPGLQLRLLQAQRVYADQSPRLNYVREQLTNLDKRLHALQQKYRAVSKKQA